MNPAFNWPQGFKMAVMYKENQKHDTPVDPESLTEQEHIDSCDVNKMLRRAAQGYQIRGNKSELVYGEDDTTMDAVQFRIKKAELEKELTEKAKTTELTEEEAKYLSPEVQKKFGFKVKPKKPAQKNDEPNDDKKSDPNLPKQEPDQKPKPSPS